MPGPSSRSKGNTAYRRLTSSKALKPRVKTSLRKQTAGAVRVGGISSKKAERRTVRAYKAAGNTTGRAGGTPRAKKRKNA